MSEHEKIHTSVRAMALSGMMAALGVVIMCLGGLIPFATFVCPMICMVILQLVAKLCGNRLGWTWYAAVSLLSLLMGPDKEGTAVFIFMGYYPLIKPKMDKLPLKWLWKGIYFNVVILIMYTLLIHLFGMAQLAAEFQEMGMILLVITLILGNVTFFLMDMILSRRMGRK